MGKKVQWKHGDIGRIQVDNIEINYIEFGDGGRPIRIKGIIHGSIYHEYFDTNFLYLNDLLKIKNEKELEAKPRQIKMLRDLVLEDCRISAHSPNMMEALASNPRITHVLGFIAVTLMYIAWGLTCR